MSRRHDPVPGAAADPAAVPTWADLTQEVVEAALGDRSVRAYPAMLSTEADATAWARRGGPHGAVVVADYQASPRGRGGLPWHSEPGCGLGFSLLLRPQLEAARDGWLYTVTTCALTATLADADGRLEIRWPDEVLADSRRVAGVGVHVEEGPAGIDAAVVTVLVEDAAPPRAPLLAELVTAIEQRLADDPEELIAAHTARCRTLGRQVVAHLVPLGPAGARIEGEAVGSRPDGSLAIQTGPGRRIAVPPRDLGRLEEP